MKKMRVKQAADYLNVTPQTIRNWTNDGSLTTHGYNGAGQRIFAQEDLDSYKRNRLGLPPLEEPKPATIFYIGYTYLVELFHAYNATIIVLDSDETKEPPEILIQDFMSLLASFSGKFYRMRGWEQRKKFLNDVQKEVSKHA